MAVYPYCLHNGEIISLEKASLPVASKAVFFDYGVYESLKVIKGKAFYPEFHVERLFESVEAIGATLPYSREQLLAFIQKTIEANALENALLRVVFYAKTDVDEPQFFIYALGLTFYSEKYYSRGHTAVFYSGERFLPESKSMNLLLNYLAYEKARAAGAIDALLVDAKERVREGTRTNLFYVKNGTVYTPPLSDVLNGITRKLLLEACASEGISILEKRVSKDELLAADEVFITSTSTSVMPIVELEGKKINGGIVGQISKKLRKLFKEKYSI